ncbi:MAG: 16S rRNA (uracil(1498)-N(3))-methyltransferase [Gemmatimonadota bacterium]
MGRRAARPLEGAARETEEGGTSFLLDRSWEVGERAALSAAEAHHALRVLRLGAGAIVAATDGRGGRYRLRLLPEGGGCGAEVLDRTSEPAPSPAVEVGVGAGRRERLLWCVEKLTELEARRIAPLLSATVQAPRHLAEEAGERLADKAAARAAAALKQSRGAWLTRVSSPVDPRTWASQPFAGVAILLAPRTADVPPLAVAALARLREQPRESPPAFRLAIGPEGGFLESEEEMLLAAGFTRAHLGERRLRFETAAVAALCQVRAAAALAEAPCAS